jgi:hypothetical protein
MLLSERSLWDSFINWLNSNAISTRTQSRSIQNASGHCALRHRLHFPVPVRNHRYRLWAQKAGQTFLWPILRPYSNASPETAPEVLNRPRQCYLSSTGACWPVLEVETHFNTQCPDQERDASLQQPASRLNTLNFHVCVLVSEQNRTEYHISRFQTIRRPALPTTYTPFYDTACFTAIKTESRNT